MHCFERTLLCIWNMWSMIGMKNEVLRSKWWLFFICEYYLCLHWIVITDMKCVNKSGALLLRCIIFHKFKKRICSFFFPSNFKRLLVQLNSKFVRSSNQFSIFAMYKRYIVSYAFQMHLMCVSVFVYMQYFIEQRNIKWSKIVMSDRTLCTHMLFEVQLCSMCVMIYFQMHQTNSWNVKAKKPILRLSAFKKFNLIIIRWLNWVPIYLVKMLFFFGY